MADKTIITNPNLILMVNHIDNDMVDSVAVANTSFGKNHAQIEIIPQPMSILVNPKRTRMMPTVYNGVPMLMFVPIKDED